LEEAMKNSVLEADPKRYGRLLPRKPPAVIRTEEENERLIAELEQFDRHYEELTPEEREYSELLTVLMKPSRTPTTPSKDRLASEVVSGKRAISNAQAEKLAALFHVPADLFL